MPSYGRAAVKALAGTDIPECPACGWQPYDASDDTCPNPGCEKHWSKLVHDPEARAALLAAAREALLLVLLVVGTLLAQLWIHWIGPLNDVLGGQR